MRFKVNVWHGEQASIGHLCDSELINEDDNMSGLILASFNLTLLHEVCAMLNRLENESG